jgi:hypothetical protein
LTKAYFLVDWVDTRLHFDGKPAKAGFCISGLPANHLISITSTLSILTGFQNAHFKGDAHSLEK